MNRNRVIALAILGLAAVILLYHTLNSEPGMGTPVPKYQDEAQTMGLSINSPFNASLNINPTITNTRPQPHFWVPGLDPCPESTKSVQYTPHRYPALPGGNLSSVMHQGIVGACCNNAPDRDWYFNPPEAAVL